MDSMLARLSFWPRLARQVRRASSFVEAPPRSQRLLTVTIHACMFAIAGFLAFAVRFEMTLSTREWVQMGLAVPIWVIVKSLAFRLMHLDGGWVKYVSAFDVKQIALANLIGSALSTCILFVAAPVPRSIYILDFLICVQLTAGLRILPRILADGAALKLVRGSRSVCIYGAGNAGVMLLRELHDNPRLGYRVAGFCDDNPHMTGRVIDGVPVLGAGAELPSMAATRGIGEVLIAMPSATGQELVKVLEHCRAARLPCKTIPSLIDIIQGSGLATQIRDVAVEDLLGRTPVVLDLSAIHAKLQDRVVLVTGAAGSIGSELCRQIARFRSKAIIGFDISRDGLFHLEREMAGTFPRACVSSRRSEASAPRSASGSDVHPSSLRRVPRRRAQARADDGVQPRRGVENNVLGTLQLALAAPRDTASGRSS